MGKHPTVRVAGRHRHRQRRSKRYTLLRMTVGWSTDFHLPRNLCTYIASPSPTWNTRQKPKIVNTCANVPEKEGKETSVRVLVSAHIWVRFTFEAWIATFEIMAQMHAFQCIIRKIIRANLSRRILPGCNFSLYVHHTGQLVMKA